MDADSKILRFEDLVSKVAELRGEGRKVVLSMGVFDLIHPGIVNHVDSAKAQGDVLVVAVLRDRHARFGPGRPVFQEMFRARNAAALEQVDYVCITDNATPFECVRRIRPDIFAKGKADRERDRLIFGRDLHEEENGYFGDARVFETDGFSFSSSHIINRLLDLYPEETKRFLRGFAEKYSFSQIAESIHNLKDMDVYLIGDGIIDEYHYCEAMNRSSKTPLVVNRYLHHEVYPGGVFAIAAHLSGICGHVHLVTLLGNEGDREGFIRESLRSNVDCKFFLREDGPTIVKKRYINASNNWKLFEVNYLNNHYIGKGEAAAVIDYIRATMPAYDVALVSDFGHGFITDEIMKGIGQGSRLTAINTQTNAANAGYNLITKYKGLNYVCLDETEVRLASQRRFDDIEDVSKAIREEVDADYLVATLGRSGSIGVSRGGEVNRTPVFSTKVVDTIGAGDAFFSFTAPCFAKGMPLDLVSFIGNAVGALAVQIMGNKRPVEKAELLEFIYAILK